MVPDDVGTAYNHRMQCTNFVPDALVEEYGSNPGSILGFLRIRLQ